MTTTVRTHYDVLGVASHTPDVVIKAAFRALAKTYHPDGAGGEAGDPERFIEIQKAYAVLSNPDSRSEYDAGLRESSGVPQRSGAGSPFAGAANGAAHWPHVPLENLEAERIYARLCLYSDALAQSFHEAYVRGECGDDMLRYADALEKEFFREFFGEDTDVQALARLLLLKSRSGAALTLNQLVAGGVSSHTEDIRGILVQILDQHFGKDALFAEWLKVKFGILQVKTLPDVTKAEPSRPRQKAAVPAGPSTQKRRLAHGGTVLRSFATVFMWAIALYFALFAAFPLLQ